MALTYDFTRCSIADPWSDENRHLSEAIIWGCLGTGIGTLTIEDLPEYRARMIVAGYWQRSEAPKIEDLLPYVGLRTNVFPKETRAKWMKRVIGSELDSLVRASRVPA